jgi:hypothetical protein
MRFSFSEKWKLKKNGKIQINISGNELFLFSLCPECLFYTLGNLEKSGKQFSKTGSKV